VDDHQTRNAEFLLEAGAARLLPEPECTPQELARVLNTLLGDRETLLNMAVAARGVAMPAAAQRVASECLEFTGK
jgi:UDP-N-acetylglucosamine--N-acetylmuramyl-(pentapeptide) pyrophosphoryl-undecaprenol N-acetylglucosamine transferase